MERQPVKLIPPASQTKANQEEAHGAYFAKVKKEGLEYIPSGCTLLDCVLGGGWPLGRMSNIVGDKSAGKCIVNSAMILTPDGFVDLQNLEPKHPMGESSYNQQVMVSRGNVDTTTHFYKEPVSQYYRVETNSGFIIEVTADHPIAIWADGCETVMKRGHSLELNDYAIIASSTHQYGKNEIHPSLAYLIGIVTDLPVMTTEDNLIVYVGSSMAKQVISQHLITLGTEIQVDGAYFIVKDQTNVTSVVNTLIQYSNTNSIPRTILSGTLSTQLQFLRGLMDTTSWLSSNTFYYKTCNEKLSRQIQLMLLNMGIVCNRKKLPQQLKGINMCQIEISGKNLNWYANLVGSDVHNLPVENEHRHGNIIPNLLTKMTRDHSKFKNLVDSHNRVAISKLFDLEIKNYQQYESDSWELLNRFIALHEPYESVGADLSFYKDLANSGFFMDRIKSITKIKEDTIAYDVHIPKDHKFWCNGFISHNTLLAIEACCNFNLIYPDGKIIYLEGEAAFDTDYASALGMPINDIEFAGEDLEDYTIESWFDHLTETLNKITKTEQPCLYVVDSLDSLSDRAEKERDITKGTYGAAKPKLIGELFRRLVKDMEQTRLHLMIISQVRDKIGVMFGEKHTRTGGRAMDFYASQILWLAQIKKLEKTILKQTRTYGTMVKAKCKKNKVGLPYRECEFPVVFGYGIDDIAAMITWLESISAKDSILRIINQSSYKSSAALSEELKQVDRQSRIQICNELASEVIDQWELIEQKFLPTTSKY